MLISSILNKNRQKQVRIAVFGDCMVDEFYRVSVKRISPEAPIPVMLSNTDKPDYVLPGGAANVAYQLKHWNVDCSLFGLMSVVDAEIYTKCGLRVPDCWPNLQNRVPRKVRFQDQQSLVRWDIEQPNYGEDISSSLDELVFAFERQLKDGLDIVILSDYGKGVFADCGRARKIVSLCNKYDIRVIVDPKGEPIEKWAGCDCFKPNSVEATIFAKTAAREAQCRAIWERIHSDVVVTYGGDGVVGIAGGEFFSVPPTEKVYIKNFSGAGDCFVAFLALSMAHGFGTPEAAKIANYAGSRYIQRNHNTPVCPLEMSKEKFVHPYDLKKRDFKLAATNGCYDLLTAAHISTFEFAKSKAEKLVVLINSDDSIRRLKGETRPIVPLDQRKKVIASLECVDYVIDFAEDSPYDLIKEIGPDVLVKGADWKTVPSSAELVKEFYFAPLVGGISTTNIVQKIRSSEPK